MNDLGFHETIAEQNLSLVILAALARESRCVCSVTSRVLASSAIFLTISHHNIHTEVIQLASEGLIESFEGKICSNNCDEEYRLSTRGGQVLSAGLEQLQASELSVLADWREESKDA